MIKTKHLLGLLFLLVLQFQAQGQRMNGMLRGAGEDKVQDILVVNANRWLFTGTTRSVGQGNQLVSATMLDTTGTVLWSYAYGDTGRFDIRDVLMAPDSGFYLIGERSNDAFDDTNVLLMRIDKQGQLLWSKTHEAGSSEYGLSLAMLPSGDLLMFSTDNSFQNAGFCLSRISPMGDIIWSQVYGGIANDFAAAMQVVGNRVILAGYTGSFGQGSFDILVMQTDTLGFVAWSNVIGTAQSEIVNDLSIASDGTIYLAGERETTDVDAIVLKLDAAGRLLHNCYLPVNVNGAANAIKVTDEGRVFAGLNQYNPFTSLASDYCLLELDTTCLPLSTNYFGGYVGEIFIGMQWLGSGMEFLLGGWGYGFPGGLETTWYRSDNDGIPNCDETVYTAPLWQSAPLVSSQPTLALWTPTYVTLNWSLTTYPITWVDSTLCLPVALTPPQANFQLEVGPNPTSDFLNVHWDKSFATQPTITLWGMNGRSAMTMVCDHGTQSAHFDLSRFTAGIYVLEFRIGQSSSFERIVVAD